MTTDRKAAARAIDAFLVAIGRDAAEEPALVGTGARVADAFIDELCDGYGVDTAALLQANAIAGSTELVCVKDITITTTCPHHLLPATGRATVVFAPSDRLVGIGTVVRLVDAFAHRLALQEAIGDGVVRALDEGLAPRWAGCRIVLEHGCMTARGERRHGAKVETIALSRGLTEATRTFALTVLGADS